MKASTEQQDSLVDGLTLIQLQEVLRLAEQSRTANQPKATLQRRRTTKPRVTTWGSGVSPSEIADGRVETPPTAPGVLSRSVGWGSVGAALAARREHRTTPEVAGPVPDVPEKSGREQGWELKTVRQKEKWPRRALRYLAVAACVLVIISGVFSIIGTITSLGDTTENPTTATGPSIGTGLEGLATEVALRYFTWDEDLKTSRPDSLAAIGIAREGDGWDGNGTLVALNAIPMSTIKLNDSFTVVLLNVRTTARVFQSAEPTSTATAEPLQAVRESSEPSVLEPASNELWLPVAVPILLGEHNLVTPQAPVLLGSLDPLTQAIAPVDGLVDQDLSTETRAVGQRMLSAYATGDLDYLQTPEADITGLGGQAELAGLTSWQVHAAQPGSSDRVVTAAVVWALPGGAGQVRCSYDLRIQWRENRWLLAAINPSINES